MVRTIHGFWWFLAFLIVSGIVSSVVIFGVLVPVTLAAVGTGSVAFLFVPIIAYFIAWLLAMYVVYRLIWKGASVT